MRFRVSRRFPGVGFAVLGLAMLAFGCASGAEGPRVAENEPGAGPVAAPAGGGEEMPPAQAPGHSSAAVAAALEAAVDGGWQDLRLLVECRRERLRPFAVEIFGTAVAIRDREAQFDLTPDGVRQILALLQSAGFADMREVYGGRKDPEPEDWPRVVEPPTTPPGSLPPGGAQAPRVTCRIELELDGVAKSVVQVEPGDVYEPLASLAGRIEELCRPAARKEIRAADLEDGLKKLAAGELAAESLLLIAHRKPRDAEGWLLRVEKGTVSGRRFTPGAGYSDPRRRRLEKGEAVDLARTLLEEEFAGLPAQLYAEHYTDLTVAVLNRRKSLQARGFAGLTPTTHAEAQGRFERAFERIEGLFRRIVGTGT